MFRGCRVSLFELVVQTLSFLKSDVVGLYVSAGPISFGSNYNKSAFNKTVSLVMGQAY